MEEPTLDGVLAAAKSKRYALARLRRMCMCAALGIRAGMNELSPPYARLLAVGPNGRELLRMIEGRARVPVITKSAMGGSSRARRGSASSSTPARATSSCSAAPPPESGAAAATGGLRPQ